MQDYRKVVKEVYNGKIPEDHILALNDALSGNQVPLEIAQDTRFIDLALIANRQRKDIDKRSQQLVDILLSDINTKLGSDSLGVEQLRNLVGTDIPASVESSINLMTGISDNIGGYLHRTYAIHRVPSWEDAILTKGGEFRKRREDALNYFINKINSTPHSLSQQKVGEIANQQMVNFIRKNGKDKKALSSLSNDSFDPALIKRKKVLDENPELRALLGEYVDPMIKYKHSIESLEVSIAPKLFFADFMAIAKKQGIEISDVPDQEGRLVKIGVKDSVIENPFEGMYAEPHVAKFIERSMLESRLDGWAKAMIKTNSIWQAAHTVYSLPTTAANVVSIVPVMLATASISGTSVVDTYSAMKQLYGTITDDPKIEADWEKKYGFTRLEILDYMSQNQISHGGAMGGETSHYLTEAGDSWIGNLFDSTFTNQYEGTGITEDGAKSFLNEIGSDGVAVKELFEKLYNFGDSLPKIMIFLNELKRLNEIRAIDPNVMTAQDAMDAAGHLAKQQAPQYTRVVELVKDIRKFPTTGQFVAFKAQLYQTISNQSVMNFALLNPSKNDAFIKAHFYIDLSKSTTSHQREDIEEILKDRGIKKSVAMITTIAGFGVAMSLGISSLRDDDDDLEVDIQHINNLMPEYYAFNNKQYIGKDEDGVMEFVNTSRMNMYGDINLSARILYDYMTRDNVDGVQAAKNFADSLFSPFYDPTFVTKVIAASGNKDSWDRAIVVDEDGLIKNAGNVFSYFQRELLQNGTTKIIGEIYDDLVSEETINERTGYRHSAGNAGMNALGASTIKFDPKKQSAYWFYRVKDKDKKLRARLSGKLKSFNKIPEDQIKTFLLDAKAEHEKIYTELITKIESARAVGLNEDEILEAIKISGAGSRSFKRYLSKGLIPPFILGRIGSKGSKRVDFQNLSNDARISYKANYETARNILNNLVD